MNRIIGIFNSKLIAFLIAIVLFIVHLIMRKYNYSDYHNVLGWDILAYYIYLPFTFIHGDPGISDQAVVQYIFDTYNPSTTFYQAYPLENGNWSPMYSIGFAILYFPFFVIGHIWALLSDYPADGFSYPYRFAISNGVMVYVLGGIFVFRKVLLHFFNDRTASIVLIIMAIGTNYYHEVTVGEMGPHSILFTGLSIMLYLNMKWHKNPTAKTAFWFGLISGLVILSRASTIFLAIVVVLWNIYDKDSLIQKIRLLIDNYRSLFIGLISLSIFPLFQMIYWKLFTGEFIFNPYQVTPGFNWFYPQFDKVMFSFQKGWLIYIPLMSLSLLGCFLAYKHARKEAISIVAFIAFYIYFISSWGTWWGGGGYVARYFVETYAVMCIPIGFVIKEVNAKKWLTLLFYPICSFLIFLNQFQIWQFNNFLFDGYTMTKEYYWKIFLKTTVTSEDRKLQEVARDFLPYDTFRDPENYTHRTVEFLDFEHVNTITVPEFMLERDLSKSAPNSCKIDPSWTYGPTFKIPFPEITPKRHAWLKVSFDYYLNEPLEGSNAYLVIEMNHNKGQYIEKRRNFNLASEEYAVNEWNYFEIDYLTPEPLHEEIDEFIIYVYVDNKPIFIDNFKVEAYERKW